MVVKVKDNGFKNYKEAFQGLDAEKIVVGLFADVGDEVLTKGIVNEFGTTKAGKNHNITIPGRPFLRSTYNKNYKKVAGRFTKIAKSISKGDYQVKKKLKLIGLDQEAAVKKMIVEIKTPANAEATIRKKKSSNPLIDTGELRTKISSELRSK